MQSGRKVTSIDAGAGNYMGGESWSVISPHASKAARQDQSNDAPITSGLSTQPEFEFNERTQAAVRSDFKVRRLFTTRNGREMLESEEAVGPPLPLFGHLFQEGETAVMFGERSSGKSVLAVQIADAITRGVPVEPFDHCPRKQRVLYVDLSLSERQFNLRYAADNEHPGEALTNRHKFSTRFNRAEADPLAEMPGNFKRIEEFMLARIAAELEATKAKVLIVDNIDRFNGEMMRTRDLAFVMSRIRKLKAIFGPAVLILAELPCRSQRAPLSPDRLMATRLLSSFADSVFAVGRCRWDESYRYIRHFRAAGGEVLLDDTHVPTFRVVKQNGNFLAFRFEFYKPESFHHQPSCDKHRYSRVDRIKALTASGISQRRIARFMEMSLGSVNRAAQMWSPWNEKPAKAAPEVLEELARSEAGQAVSPTKIAQNVERAAESAEVSKLQTPRSPGFGRVPYLLSPITPPLNCVCVSPTKGRQYVSKQAETAFRG